MTMRRPEAITQPHPPLLTLRLDDQHAWRQSGNAIIIPIVYDLLDSTGYAVNRDPLTLPVALGTPAPDDFAGPVVMPDVILPQSEDKEVWPKIEPGFAVSVLNGAQGYSDSFFFSPSGSAFSQVRRLSTAVLLLLLGGIALVFFAWMVFR